jgi:membrane protein YdbS with pleckstrin-like domain
MARFPNATALSTPLPDDTVIFSFYRVWFYELKYLAVFFLLLAAVVFVSLQVVEPTSNTPVWLRLLTFLPLVVLLETLRRHYNQVVVVKSNVLEYHQGRLGLAYSLPIIDYSDIREIRIDQSVLARILDFGDVAVSTAGSDSNEIEISGVPSPHKFKLVLEKLRAVRDSKHASTEKLAGD